MFCSNKAKQKAFLLCIEEGVLYIKRQIAESLSAVEYGKSALKHTIWRQQPVMINWIISVLCTIPIIHDSFAANIYPYTSGNVRSLPSYVLPLTMQQQPQQQQQQQQQYITQSPLQQNSYTYDPLGTSSFPENGGNQGYNYAYLQPTSFGQSQLTLSLEQLQLKQQQQREQQRLPIWFRRPIVVDQQTPERYNIPAFTSTSNFYAINPEIPRNDLRSTPQHQNHNPFISSYANDGFYRQTNQNSNSYKPNSFLDVTSFPDQSSNRFSTTAADNYAAHFERYLRKYPNRLQP